VDLQMVLNHLHGDSGHLRRFPGEHVDICPEEGDERAFLFLSQVPRALQKAEDYIESTREACSTQL
jgi:hypothetical protein